jgi:hypothetical protein
LISAKKRGEKKVTVSDIDCGASGTFNLGTRFLFFAFPPDDGINLDPLHGRLH